jgi:predicted helicase
MPATAIDDFVTPDSRSIKWSSSLKQSLAAGERASAVDANFRTCLYRPYATQHL